MLPVAIQFGIFPCTLTITLRLEKKGSKYGEKERERERDRETDRDRDRERKKSLEIAWTYKRERYYGGKLRKGANSRAAAVRRNAAS